MLEEKVTLLLDLWILISYERPEEGPERDRVETGKQGAKVTSKHGNPNTVKEDLLPLSGFLKKLPPDSLDKHPHLGREGN